MSVNMDVNNMEVNIPIRKTITATLREMGHNPENAGQVIVLKTEDKFFVGHGCEEPERIKASGKDHNGMPVNISICMNLER